MDLKNQWQDGIERVTAALPRLAETDLARLRALCRQMMEQKLALHALSARVDAASHCAGCGGACCVKGKYHFTAADLLVYLATGEELFVPLFENGLCPYLAGTACLMPPQYRPFNCITFNCDLIEDRLAPEEVSRFYELERELRKCYRDVRALFPGGSMDGALLKGA